MIGAEPLIIGAEPQSPPYNPPAAPAAGGSRALLVLPQPKRKREWPGADFWRGLKTDPGLILGTLSLAAGLLLWAWLSHGGLPAPRGLWAVADPWLARVPAVLFAAAFVFLGLSIVPDLDCVAMDLQRRWARRAGG